MLAAICVQGWEGEGDMPGVGERGGGGEEGMGGTSTPSSSSTRRLLAACSIPVSLALGYS